MDRGKPENPQPRTQDLSSHSLQRAERGKTLGTRPENLRKHIQINYDDKNSKNLLYTWNILEEASALTNVLSLQQVLI